jgi:hypothetical protein
MGREQDSGVNWGFDFLISYIRVEIGTYFKESKNLCCPRNTRKDAKI